MKGSDMTKSSVMIQGLNSLQMDCESEWQRFHQWLCDNKGYEEAA